MRRKKAFTLVELLVVIGIIAVLISILLPAISRARKQAVRIVCMSNLRQLATCVAMYESEYKAQLPGYKISQMRETATSVMFWEPLNAKPGGDGDADDLLNDGSASPTDFPLTDRHEKGGHVCCFDGHVEWWDQKTFTQWATLATFGRLWCNPTTANGR